MLHQIIFFQKIKTKMLLLICIYYLILTYLFIQNDYIVFIKHTNVTARCLIQFTSKYQFPVTIALTADSWKRYQVTPSKFELASGESCDITVDYCITSRDRLDPKGRFHKKSTDPRGIRDPCFRVKVMSRTNGQSIEKFMFSAFITFFNDPSDRDFRNMFGKSGQVHDRSSNMKGYNDTEDIEFAEDDDGTLGVGYFGNTSSVPSHESSNMKGYNDTEEVEFAEDDDGTLGVGYFNFGNTNDVSSHESTRRPASRSIRRSKQDQRAADAATIDRTSKRKQSFFSIIQNKGAGNETSFLASMLNSEKNGSSQSKGNSSSHLNLSSIELNENRNSSIEGSSSDKGKSNLRNNIRNSMRSIMRNSNGSRGGMGGSYHSSLRNDSNVDSESHRNRAPSMFSTVFGSNIIVQEDDDEEVEDPYEPGQKETPEVSSYHHLHIETY
jgi:hypothetical protein